MAKEDFRFYSLPAQPVATLPIEAGTQLGTGTTTLYNPQLVEFVQPKPRNDVYGGLFVPEVGGVSGGEAEKYISALGLKYTKGITPGVINNYYWGAARRVPLENGDFLYVEHTDITVETPSSMLECPNDPRLALVGQLYDRVLTPTSLIEHASDQQIAEAKVAFGPSFLDHIYRRLRPISIGSMPENHYTLDNKGNPITPYLAYSRALQVRAYRWEPGERHRLPPTFNPRPHLLQMIGSTKVRFEIVDS